MSVTGPAGMDTLFIVDVEASSRTPMTGMVTEFAAVHVRTGSSFYGHLYRSHPDPMHPAVPVIDRDSDGKPIVEAYWIVDGKSRDRAVVVNRVGEVAVALSAWLEGFGLRRRTLISDNNGYDAMWLNCFTDNEIRAVVFGHSSRRIGDFYAGTKRQWTDHSSWKKLRRTRHTHHPLDDAHGNAEALRTLLDIADPT